MPITRRRKKEDNQGPNTGAAGWSDRLFNRGRNGIKQLEPRVRIFFTRRPCTMQLQAITMNIQHHTMKAVITDWLQVSEL